MATYTKTTNFTAKDNLTSGDPAKVIKGSEFDTEFNAIETAVNSKANANNGTHTGTTTISTANIDTLQIDGVTVTATAAELNTLDGITATTAELNITDGLTATTSELNILDGATLSTDELNLLDGVTATTTELNILDGVTSTTAEINKLDGFTGTVDDLNYAKDLRATGVTTAEFDKLDGLTATTAELNITDGLTATTAELNVLDGITATTTELNYTDGVTSNIQTQLDSKAPIASPTFTGTTTIPTVDINGGDIDGVQIGTVSPNAGVFSTLNTNSSFEAPNIDDNGTKVDLKNGGATKLATTSTGVDVTGTITADGLTVEGTLERSGAGTQYITSTNTTNSLTSSFGSTSIGTVIKNDSAEDMLIRTNDNNRLKLSSNGDIQFYEDTGTTAKMVWDASAETLEIGYTNDKLSVYEGFYRIKKDGSNKIFVGNTADALGSGTGMINYLYDAEPFIWYQGSERMRIDSSGNVGIGTASPSAKLQVFTSAGRNFKVDQSTANKTVLSNDYGLTLKAGSGYSLDLDTGNASGSIRFLDNGAERARIDSSGNLLVGTTDSTLYDGVSGEGLVYRAGNELTVARSGASPATLVRQSSDGVILNFKKDGSPVGSIGVDSGSNATAMFIGSNDTGLEFAARRNDTIAPFNPSTNIYRDDAINLGGATERFKDLYLSGGVQALGATSGTAIARNKFGFEPTTQWAAVFKADSANSGSAIVFLNSSASIVGSIGMTTTSTSFNTSSDYRLKENVSEMTNASERVKALKPCRFNFIADPDKTVDGFIAHEAQEVVPEAVTGAKDAMRTEEYEVAPAVLDDDGNVIEEAVMGTREVPDYQGIDQSKLVPLLTKALQEALERIEALEAKL